MLDLPPTLLALCLLPFQIKMGIPTPSHRNKMTLKFALTNHKIFAKIYEVTIPYPSNPQLLSAGHC